MKDVFIINYKKIRDSIYSNNNYYDFLGYEEYKFSTGHMEYFYECSSFNIRNDIYNYCISLTVGKNSMPMIVDNLFFKVNSEYVLKL